MVAVFGFVLPSTVIRVSFPGFPCNGYSISFRRCGDVSLYHRFHLRTQCSCCRLFLFGINLETVSFSLMMGTARRCSSTESAPSAFW